MPVFEVRQVVMCAAGEWRLHAKRVAVVRELAESDPRLIARAMTLPSTLPDQSFTNLARLGCPISAHDESCPEKPSLYNFISSQQPIDLLITKHDWALQCWGDRYGRGVWAVIGPVSSHLDVIRDTTDGGDNESVSI